MEKYCDLSDEELIFKFRNGEVEIIDYIMDKYKNMVRNKAKAMFLIGGESDDLIQEGMIGLFKAIRDFDSQKDSAFYTFADLCVSRQMYTAIEASQRKKHNPLNSYISFSSDLYNSDGSTTSLLDTMQSCSEGNPETVIIAKENARIINEKLVNNLSKFENSVMTLYLEGHTYQEIAELLDKTPKSIDNALQRIKNKLSDLS